MTKRPASPRLSRFRAARLQRCRRRAARNRERRGDAGRFVMRSLHQHKGRVRDGLVHGPHPVYFPRRAVRTEGTVSAIKDSAKVGVIGGSGFYELLENAREVTIDTPFGAPSDSYFLGDIDGVPVAFLPRHARGHRILPGEVNYRANIWGMKALGVHYVLSASAFMPQMLAR